jgi:methyl-accepting chemotaxis protein
MNLNFKITYSFLFVLLYSFSTVYSQEHGTNPLIVLNDHQGQYCIGKDILYLVDQSKQLTFNDVNHKLHTDFIQNTTKIPNFGFSDSVYWLTWQVVYTGQSEKEWLLEIGYPHLDKIELYIIDNIGKIEIRKAGDTYSFDQREMAYKNFIFHIRFKPDEIKRFYLKVRSESSIQIPLYIWDKISFSENVVVVEVCYGLFVGCMTILFFYNIFLLISIRNNIILSLLLSIGTYVLAQLSINGHAFQYLWQETPLLANKSIPLWIIVSGTCFFRFSIRFIEPYRFSVMINTILGITFVSGLLIIPLSLTMPYKYIIKLVVLYSVFSSAIVLFSGFLSVYKKKPASRFFCLGWLSYFVGLLMYALKTAGVLPSNFLTEYSYQLGTVIFIMLMSNAIVDRIYYQRNQNEQELRNALDSTNQLLKAQKIIRNSQDQTGQQIDMESDRILKASDELNLNYEEVNKQAENVSGISEQMTDNIKTIADSIGHMGHSIDNTLSMAQELSSNIQIVFQSLDQMSESMQTIEDNAHKGFTISDNALKLSHKTTHTMTDLDQAAMEIGKVSDFIRRISDKTNLLSLNAAIESASSGEKGKGFAVVANSIQKFADQSAMAADDITQVISDVQTRAQEANVVIANIADIVKSIHTSSEKSSTAIQTQGKTIIDIVQHSAKSKDEVKNISQSIEDLANNASDILKHINNIAVDFNQVSSNIKDVSMAIQRSREGVVQIKDVSIGLSETSKELCL